MSLEVQGINSGPLQVEQTLAPQRDLVVEQQVGSLQQLLHTPQVDLQTRTDSLTRRVQEKLSPSETVQNPNGLHLINTRLWLHQLSEIHARPMTIKDVPTAEWDKLFDTYDSIWFMGIYKPSSASQNHAKKWHHEYKYALPDIDPERDVAASPFAIPEYTPNPAIARDWEEWDEMVEMLHENGKSVVIDFVPNHMGLDHPWTRQHPEYFVQGSPEQVRRNPGAYMRVEGEDGKEHHLAHGKDPNYPEWHDTVQLNYARPDVQAAMENELLQLVDHADGVRCDMAMLLNPGTFLRTWGRDYDDSGNWIGMNHLSSEERAYIEENSFWPKATQRAKEKAKQLGREDFSFIAEAYWDKEELGQSFDYIYGKDFYDHLGRVVREEPGESPEHVRWHLIYLATANRNGRQYNDLLFIENHDEERAAHALKREPSQAAAVVTAFVPDALQLFNQGQEEGRKIRPPMQINRMPDEEVDQEMTRFYQDLHRLRRSEVVQKGTWRLAHLNPDNTNIIAQQIERRTQDGEDEIVGEGVVIFTNLSSKAVEAVMPELGEDKDVLGYSLSEGDIVDDLDTMRQHGMYVGLKPWETQVFFYSSGKEPIS